MENSTSLILIPGRNQFSFKFISLLLLFLVTNVGAGWGQTPNGFLDFGNTANGTTATVGNTGFGGVRVGGGGGSFTIQNSGQSIGTNAELKGIAPTTTSVNSVGITSAEFGTAASTFTVSFEVYFSGGTSGTWTFSAGNGASYAAAQTATFSGADSFSLLRWVFGTSNTITTNNRAVSTWGTTGITGTPFTQGTAYNVSIIGNNSASTVNYGTSQSVGAYKYDLWVNGVLVGDELGKAQIANGTSINAFRFYSESSTGNVATIALDNIRWYNTCILPPTHLAFVSTPATGTTGTNLSSFTVEARSGSATGPISTAFTGAITLAKASGSGSISGTLAPSASSGIATYNNIQFDAADTYTISASSSSPILGSTSSNIVVSSSGEITSPTLNADATLNTVDNNIDITFTENATWRGLISAVKVGGTALTPTTDYVLSAGNIQLKPSGGNSLLTTAGSKTITVEAPGYSVATVTQAINAGAANKLAMKTQPAAPASNGAVLGTQPEVYIQDQYGNATTSTETITAAVGAGTWTLGGTTAVAGVAGTVSYSGLTATSSAAVSGATISFSGTGLTGITSGTFNIPTPPPTITVTTLDGFGSIAVNSTSGELSYVVSAEQLTADLIITPPVDFEISTTSGSGFISNPSTLALTQTGGTINPTTIYVRFSPKTVQTYSATITHTSTGATTKNVAVSGTATATAAPVAATATDITDISFTANWGTVSGASGYKLDVSTTPFGAATNATDLFISEYVEGTSNNKYLEIYNGTGSAIDLSNYKLQFYANGNATVNQDIQLSGTLGSGSTVVYKNSSAAIFSGTATINAAVQFNGNDAVALYKISTSSYIDIFGKIGEDPTTAWTSGSLTTLDKTLVRKSTVTSGVAANPSSGFPTLSTEWDQYNTDDVSNLGTHTFSGGIPSLLTGYNDLSVSGTSQSVTGLTGNTTYYYQVRSTAGGAASANSNSITVLTAPSAPTATEETDNSATGFVATWTLPAGGATSYTLDVATDNTFSTLVSGYNNLSVTGTTQAVTGLAPNTTYYYRIKATNATATATSGTITAATNNNLIVSSDINVSTLPVCATCNVIINAGATLTINENRTFNILTINPKGKLTNSASTLTLDALNIESSATGTGTYIDNGTSNIAISHVQQYLTSGRNWYVSIPVTAADTTVMGAAHAIKYWNEPTGVWKSPTALALDVKKGYIAAGTKSTGVITFDGELNNGNTTFNATRTGGAYKEGFNLIGNPYPSYVDWESAIKTNVGSSIWYRTKNLSGTYVFDTFNGIGTNNNQGGAVTGMIPPMQAVWIRVNEAQTSGSVQFTNAMRAHETGTNKFKAPAANNTIQQVLRLQVSNDVNSDEAIVLFNKNASNSVDVYDAPKMTNANSTVPEIYSLVNDNEFVINGMNDYSPSTEISLGFRTGQSNTFSIKASEIANFETGTQIILKDNELMTETNLSDGNTYTFTSDAITTTNRFSVIFKSAGVTTELSNNQLDNKLVFVNKNSNNQLVINCNSDIVGHGNILIYNTVGQKLYQKTISSTSTILDQHYSSGVYFVNVVTNSGTIITRKVIVD